MSKEKNHNSPLDNPEMKKNIFQVPDGYFNQLEARLEARLDAEGNEVALSKHLKKPVFEAPEGYFDQLENKIKARVAEDASILSKEDKLNIPPFEAPEGYFEGFEERLQSKLAGEEEESETTKVIPLYQRNWFRMAIAAVLVMGFFLFKPPLPNDGGFDGLSEETMMAYLAEEDINLDMIASLDGFDMAIDEILEEETADYDFDLGLDPELDYEFEYFEQ